MTEGEPTRLEQADLRMRLELGEWLAKMGGHIAGNDYEDGPFTRALVILWGPSETFANWHGLLTRDELYGDSTTALREAIEPEGQRPSDLASQRQEEEQAEESAKPFVCGRFGGCGLRFATERGRDSHERSAERAQAAVDALERELPFHGERCNLRQGGSHCVCGVWVPDRRRPTGDWSHSYLNRPTKPPPPLTVVPKAEVNEP